ncbi:MAG: GNAT family N-acetyltransferase [Burkholderiales bacterium PBB6]|nr:MAG: GNAT family N-acetyltransferase [Burkholderiales bacterium PBB6]
MLNDLPSALHQATSLTHDGVLLRPFEDSDAEAFAEAARTSVDTVGAWMPWCAPDYTANDAVFWFGLCRQGLVSGTAHDLGVFDARTGELLGGAGLNQINSLHRMANLGYWVRSSKQRLGVARRCVAALTAHGFHTLGLQRIEIVVAVGNTASAAVARQAGAQWECTARNRLWLHGGPVAADVFSLVPPIRPAA